MRRPETRYTRCGDICIAYQVVGEGPLNLLYAAGWISNIEYAWESPDYARFLTKLGRFSRLIFFDKRGTGCRTATSASRRWNSVPTTSEMAVGVIFVIMLGGIDLSIQSVGSLASVVAALCLPRFGYLGFVLAALTGALAGVLSGFAHVKLRIPSCIATLAIGGIAAGAALIISDAQAITMGAAERAYIGWSTGTSLGLPHEVIIGAWVLAGGLFVQRYTAFGRYSQAIGAGEPATYASGVRVDRSSASTSLPSRSCSGSG